MERWLKIISSLIVEVCKIDKSEKHPNADKLSIVEVKGWSCITGLDQYKEGDLVVFIPPDSIVPQDLIEKYNLSYLKNGGRVGTAKLRGYISQGLILDVPEGKKYKIGDDVSEELGITKWQPPESNYNPNSTNKPTKKKQNPLFDKYTDIENIKNYNNVFQHGDKVVITEKIHGSNWRASNLPIYLGKQNFFKKIINMIKARFTDGYEFCYGSHNVQIVSDRQRTFYGEDVYGKVASKYNMKDIIPKDYIVYGEVYGKKIQDLTYGLDDIDLVIFDVKYKGKYLSYEEFKKFCQERNLPIVPELYVGEWTDELVKKYTDGKSVLCSKQIKEGIVIKDYYENNHPRVGRKILKSVSVDYLLRKNATEYH